MVALYGPSGLGQDDAAVDGRHSARPHLRRGVDRRARHLLAVRARSLPFQTLRAGLHPAELRPAAGRQRDRQHRPEAAGRDALARSATRGRAAAGTARLGRAPAPPLGDALDGRAPARDDRASALHQAFDCCSPTSRPAASTRSADAKCSSCCAACAASGAWRSCLSATTRWQPTTPTACMACATASSPTTTPPSRRWPRRETPPTRIRPTVHRPGSAPPKSRVRAPARAGWTMKLANALQPGVP